MTSDSGTDDSGTDDSGTDADDEATPEERRAAFRVVRGEPTDAELAALTVVLAAVAASPADPPPRARSAWNDPAARLRRPLPVGPGAWRASGWPR